MSDQGACVFLSSYQLHLKINHHPLSPCLAVLSASDCDGLSNHI